MRELSLSNFAKTFHRTITAQVKPKRRKAVKILPPEFHKSADKTLTEAQTKIIETLLENDGAMLFTELIEKAEVGASSINTLAKYGLLEVFVQEVLRDPLADAIIPEITDLILTGSRKRF